MKSIDLTRITRILSLSRLQGPFAAPSRMKNIQKTEFQAFPKLHPSDPLYHNEIILNFEVFGTRKADIQCADKEIKVVSEIWTKINKSFNFRRMYAKYLYIAGNRPMNFE